MDPGNPGRYRIIERLAEGGMAVVDRAVAVGPDGFQRELVLKRIRPRFSRDERFARMFVDEARIASQLNHPNIVQIYEFGKIDGDYFLAMEHVPGVDLARLGGLMQDSRERFPIALAVFIIIEVCRALDYAHRKRGPDGKALDIIHRDVSPANVLISHEGAVKLADFGIARAAERKEQTLDGVVKGKVAYMSPEQLRDQPLDGRSDIFSAAVILYLLLAGEHPFVGENDGATIKNLLGHEWFEPSRCALDVPPALDRIVMKATAKDRFARHETAGHLVEDLEQFLFDSRSRASASELSALMKRLYGEEATPPPIAKVSLDGVMASELRRMAGPGDDLPHYTALIETPSTSRTGTEPMFRIPPTPGDDRVGVATRHAEDVDHDHDHEHDHDHVLDHAHATEPLQPGRWEQPTAPEPAGPPDLSLEHPRRRAAWPLVTFAGIVLTGLIAGVVMAFYLPLTGHDPPGVVHHTPDGGRSAAVEAGGPLPLDSGVRPAPLDADQPDAAPPDSGPASTDASAMGPGAPDTGTRPPPAEPHRPQVMGWLRVVTRPHYAEVFVDGRRRGTTPLLVEVPTGRRRVRLVNSQLGRSEQRTVAVEPGHGRSDPASVLVDGF